MYKPWRCWHIGAGMMTMKHKFLYILNKREIFENNMGWAAHPWMPYVSEAKFPRPRRGNPNARYWRYMNRRAYLHCQRDFAL